MLIHSHPYSLKPYTESALIGSHKANRDEEWVCCALRLGPGGEHLCLNPLNTSNRLGTDHLLDCLIPAAVIKGPSFMSQTWPLESCNMLLVHDRDIPTLVSELAGKETRQITVVG